MLKSSDPRTLVRTQITRELQHPASPAVEYPSTVTAVSLLLASARRARSQVRSAPEELRHARLVASMLLRVGWQTGMLAHINSRAAWTLLDGIAHNRTNPSLLYRLQAVTQPDKPAIIAPDRSITFAQLDRDIDRVGWGLAARGVGRGARAIFMLKNRPEFIALQPAMSRMGAAGVSISWRSTPAELEFLVNHSGARALFFDRDVADVVRAALPACKQLPRDNVFAVGGSAEGFEPYESLLRDAAPRAVQDGDEAAVIIYTSGTTGKPKGAVRKFPRDVVLGTLSIIASSPLRSDDVHLAVLPFYHSTAFAFTSFSHLVGATVVLLDSFTPEGFLEAVERYRVTQTAVVPTLLHRLLQLGEERIWQYDTRSLRAIITAGAPLSASIATRTMDVFGDVLYNFYGATETGLNTVASPADLRASPGTIGRLIENNEIHLLGDDGREVDRGKIGELYVKGPMVVAGYHDDDSATQSAQRGGMFSVGDLARLDDRGCYHLAGRKRDMIISGGVNVYPAEVEAAIESCPAVAEAAVVGAPDDEWGERVVAFVVARQPNDNGIAAAVQSHCKTLLAGPKRPREIVVLDALPRNPTGKVLKNDLRARLRRPAEATS